MFLDIIGDLDPEGLLQFQRMESPKLLEQTLCPVLEKLYEIVPKSGSVEYNAFQNEVDRQLGIYGR